MMHLSKYKASLLAFKVVVGASIHIIHANTKIITIWVSGNNKSTGLDLGVDVYARARDQVLNLEEFKILKLPSFSILNLGIF
jgi:hypothetical protein